jgi:aldehyde dehydrogenase (NAD+)
MARIPVTKTPKVYVGGQFIRSERGRVFPVREGGRGKREAGGGKGVATLLGNIPQCRRKRGGGRVNGDVGVGKR